MHAFKAGEHCVPYSMCAELGIYQHKACGSTRGKVSYLQNIHKIVARRLIRLELMPW